MSIEPDEDYVVPIGKARMVHSISQTDLEKGNTVGVVTYGRGVYWTMEAMKGMENQVEILDLRSLNPLDIDAVNDLAKKHGKVMLVTEESVEATFTLGLAGRIQRDNFESLDAPVKIVGSVDTPAIPLNSILEAELLTSGEKVKSALLELLAY